MVELVDDQSTPRTDDSTTPAPEQGSEPARGSRFEKVKIRPSVQSHLLFFQLCRAFSNIWQSSEAVTGAAAAHDPLDSLHKYKIKEGDALADLLLKR